MRNTTINLKSLIKNLTKEPKVKPTTAPRYATHRRFSKIVKRPEPIPEALTTVVSTEKLLRNIENRNRARLEVIKRKLHKPQ